MNNTRIDAGSNVENVGLLRSFFSVKRNSVVGGKNSPQWLQPLCTLQNSSDVSYCFVAATLEQSTHQVHVGKKENPTHTQ